MHLTKLTCAAALTALLAACAAKNPLVAGTPPAQPEPPPPVKAQEATPQQRAMIKTELAAGYYERGRMDVALEELNEAQKLDPYYPKTYNIYGLVYAFIGESAKAEENFRRALALAPSDSEIRHNWGAFLCAHGKPAQALPEFDAVVRDPLYKTPEIALINAGKCSLAMGDAARADDYQRRALTVSPNNPVAAYNLAYIKYRQANLREARSYMRMVMQQPNPPPDALYLGMCLERKEGDRGAESSYTAQLRNRYPESAEAKAIATGVCD
jgi:type IV pilus assembly protein PilF